MTTIMAVKVLSDGPYGNSVLQSKVGTRWYIPEREKIIIDTTVQKNANQPGEPFQYGEL